MALRSRSRSRSDTLQGMHQLTQIPCWLRRANDALLAAENTVCWLTLQFAFKRNGFRRRHKPLATIPSETIARNWNAIFPNFVNYRVLDILQPRQKPGGRLHNIFHRLL